MSIGFFGVVFTYILTWTHTLIFVLIPYTTDLMEDRIKEYNKILFEQQPETVQKVKVKRKRR